jgi:coenzyme Q-binding protein COQ10
VTWPFAQQPDRYGDDRVPTFETVRRVPFTPEQMYALVADVEHYPQFLPLCESLQVISRSQVDGQPVIVARMEIGYKAIREGFTTRVVLMPSAPAVTVTYLDGPFHHLENRWRFLPADQGTACDVAFWIDYQFKSPMLGLLMGVMFDKAFRKFSEAFEQRARAVYGTPSATLPGSTMSSA